MPQFAAYYYPFSHVDSTNEKVHGKDWTEWELIQNASARFVGHRQPRVPLWGYQDESDPAVMYQKQKVASEFGLSAFIFDWYWYEGKAVFNRALDEGYLAIDNPDTKFALMWANHDWSTMHPISLWQAKNGVADVLYKGTVTEQEFESMCRYITRKYFTHKSYWTLDGKPYFSIYNLASLLESFGSLEQAANMLGLFREMVSKAGLPGLHLNAIEIYAANIPHENSVYAWPDTIEALGFDSVTSYSWAHFPPSLLSDYEKRHITYSYKSMEARLLALWKNQRARYRVPFFPHVSVGWDSSPRTVQSDVWENIGGGPFSFIWNDANPVDFERYLQMASDFQVDQPRDFPVIINAWNEWPEASYLEPDTEHGMVYLEALKRVAVKGLCGDLH